MADIKIYKLITGEEILGEFDEQHAYNNNVIRIKNPVGVAVVRGKDGSPNVGFAPFPLHAPQKKDATIDFKPEVIVYSYEPAQDFIDNYNQIFGSGIVLPNKQIITG